MKLERGYIKIKDLSIWFGLQPETLSKSSAIAKEKKFNILSGYADYHFEGKKLYIDEVYIPEYCSAMTIAETDFEKNWGLIINRQTYQVNWQKEEMVDTCARVARQIYGKHKELHQQVSIKTFISYCNRIKVKWYGHNYINDHGEKGRSERFYVNIQEDRPLTPEELDIIRQCKRDAYIELSEKIADIDEAYAEGEITKEERDKQVGEIDTEGCYLRYLDLLLERLKYEPEKMTKLIPELYFED